MTNLTEFTFQIMPKDRATNNNLKPHVVWLTGISGSGKSSIASELESILYKNKIKTMIIDGDSLRNGLSNDLSFSNIDRDENVRRAAEVAKLMVEAGLVVIVTLISPLEKHRKLARDIITKNNFTEVFIKTTINTAEQRDPKGLYKKARQGKIDNFTGISSKYEPPKQPDLIIDTEVQSISECACKIFNDLIKNIST